MNELVLSRRAVHDHFARASASTAMYAATLLGARFSFTAHAVDIFWRPWDLDRKLGRADVAVTVCEYNRRYIAGLRSPSSDR